ncbi:MAG TPA: protein kinase [Polyangiaceae bacterium]
MPEPVVEQRARARIGTTLNGKYRLDRLLGVGGMASVYAATHRNSKRVAVKVLHAELSLHPGLRTRFMREGYLANTVDHPGAVTVLDDDVAEDGSAFLVMELLEGETLAEACDRHGGRLPLRAVLSVAYQVLDVLAAADAKSIVHRDIKPPNLFLTRTGHVKVLDFGVARLRELGGEYATHSGLAMGTPAYMAPEQALGRTEEVDGLTDVWAVGATMFALLTGGPVHEASTPQEQMVFTATRSARTLASVSPDLPSAMTAIVDRALAFERGSRWPGAAAMRDAVREAYRAEYGEDPSPAALVFMASPERLPVSGVSAATRSPMASTVPETPVSVEPRKVAGLAEPQSLASLMPTSSLARSPGASRLRTVAGALLLVAGGVAAGAWISTRTAPAPSRSPAVPPPPVETALPATASSARSTPLPALDPSPVPSPAATTPGRLKSVRALAAPSASSGMPAQVTPSASVDRFDHQ